MILTIFGSGCAIVAKRSEITDLNRVYRVLANQTFFTKDICGQISAKLLKHPANAALALGFENLADSPPLWIHRQKPWLGLTVGINLN